MTTHALHGETMTEEDTSGRDDSELPRLLGEVALNDAENDEWLVQVLSALLQPHDGETVGVLVASDSVVAKADKIKKLLQLRHYQCSPVGDQHRPAPEILQEAKRLKAARDSALHSFYGNLDEASGSFQTFRSRSGPHEATPENLRELIESQRTLRDELIALTHQIEHQVANTQGEANEVGLLMEDAREILVLARLQAHRNFDELVAALRSGQEVTVGLQRYGRWRLTPPYAVPDENWPWTATIHPNTGVISIRDRAGNVHAGGDTGWRNVTEMVRDESPEVTLAFLRRVHTMVHYAQEGGAEEYDHVVYATDRLGDRVFSTAEPAIRLPKAIRELEGFLPEGNSG